MLWTTTKSSSYKVMFYTGCLRMSSQGVALQPLQPDCRVPTILLLPLITGRWSKNPSDKWTLTPDLNEKPEVSSVTIQTSTTTHIRPCKDATSSSCGGTRILFILKNRWLLMLPNESAWVKYLSPTCIFWCRKSDCPHVWQCRSA